MSRLRGDATRHVLHLIRDGMVTAAEVERP